MSTQNELPWPEHLWSLTDITNWISSMSPNGSYVIGPPLILDETAHGIVAAFQIEDKEVVFKGSRVPIFAGRIHIEELLSHLMPDVVPELLATKALPNGITWTLHSAFSGTHIEASSDFEHVLEMAGIMADVQTRIAALPTTVISILPQSPTVSIPEMLNQMIQLISETYLDMWLDSNGALLNEFVLPANIVKQLQYFRPQIQKWTDELIAGDWPLSIDHVDLHTNNAVIRENGQLLIFDWEEATIGCPFFSIFRLLFEADKFEEKSSQRLYTEGPLALTAKQMAIRNAYIDTLPWKDRNQRERAFDVSMCLAPIKTAYYECVTVKAALNRETVHPSIPARCFGTALHYWQAMTRGCNIIT